MREICYDEFKKINKITKKVCSVFDEVVFLKDRFDIYLKNEEPNLTEQEEREIKLLIDNDRFQIEEALKNEIKYNLIELDDRNSEKYLFHLLSEVSDEVHTIRVACQFDVWSEELEMVNRIINKKEAPKADFSLQKYLREETIFRSLFSSAIDIVFHLENMLEYIKNQLYPEEITIKKASDSKTVKLKWKGTQTVLFSVLRQLKTKYNDDGSPLIENSFDSLAQFLINNIEGYESLEVGTLAKNMAKNIEPKKNKINIDLTDLS